jgi:hypothetical protein
MHKNYIYGELLNYGSFFLVQLDYYVYILFESKFIPYFMCSKLFDEAIKRSYGS